VLKLVEFVHGSSLRVVVVALALAACLAFGGTALAGLSGRDTAGSAQPGATTTVQVFASKTVKQTATSSGAVANLTSVGGISTRVVCSKTPGQHDLKLQLQFKSSPAGAFVLDSRAMKLTSSFVTLYQTGSGGGFGLGFDVMTSGGAFQHYEAAVKTQGSGVECVTHLAAMSN
jgi:hypothetical protein